MRGFDLLVSETRSRTIYDSSPRRGTGRHVRKRVARSLRPGRLRDGLHGVWLGPRRIRCLVQAPIGVGGVLDLPGGKQAARRLTNGVRLGRLRSGRAGPTSSTGQRSMNSSRSGGRQGGSDRLAPAGLGRGCSAGGSGRGPHAGASGLAAGVRGEPPRRPHPVRVMNHRSRQAPPDTAEVPLTWSFARPMQILSKLPAPTAPGPRRHFPVEPANPDVHDAHTDLAAVIRRPRDPLWPGPGTPCGREARVALLSGVGCSVRALTSLLPGVFWTCLS